MIFIIRFFVRCSLLVFGVFVVSGCLPQTMVQTVGEGALVATAVATNTPTPTATTITATVQPSATPTTTPAPTNTALATPAATIMPKHTATVTPSPKPTLRPTPKSLPGAPRGWRWVFLDNDIPVTHYIIYELDAADDGELERPYGLNDQPLPGIEPLPRSFLEQTAYQGAGRLPNGDVLEYAAVRAPVERDLAPYRFVITPHNKCEGHPLAGNLTCSNPFKTAATTWREDDGYLVPVGSTIYIPDLRMKLRINDVAVTDGEHKIDLYTGTLNNYDYERPNGVAVWVLVEDK